MAESNQPRPRLRSSDTSRSHPLAGTASHPSIARRSSGVSLAGPSLKPSISLPGTEDSSNSQMSDWHPATFHRPHANTISTTRPTRRAGNGLSEAQLLGVGPSQVLRRRSGHWSSTVSPSLDQDAMFEDAHFSRPTPIRSPKRADSYGSRLFECLDSLSKEELEIVNTRFDLMSDEELRQYTPSLATGGQSIPTLPLTNTVTVDRFPDEPAVDDSPSSNPTTSSEDQSPLFPPSPPSQDPILTPIDHPLRVLSKAIAELREAIGKLEEENFKLRKENAEKGRRRRRKSADQISIHDGLTEAISTSLTSISPIHDMTANPLALTGDKASMRSISPIPSARKSRRPPSIASSLSISFPSSPVNTSEAAPRSSAVSIGPSKQSGASNSQNNRTNWASGLWVWSGGKRSTPPHPSKGANTPALSATSTPTVAEVSESAIIDEDDVEAWRKGDGGSSPAFKAIFLATRIITPDPSSILLSSEIPSNSLIAYLAHSLVETARDDGIIARDAVSDRRRSKDLSRSRAASTGSQYPASDLDKSRETRSSGYGDQALAATASLGRSLLSSVSNATIRGTKAISSITDDPRPALISRSSSSRAFPTTAVSAPAAIGQSGSSATSPTEERPLPSVELSSIVPDDIRPPTVTLSRQNLGSFFQTAKSKLATASRFESEEEPLTDRYGFIYDIQHAKMLKDASAAGTSAPMSLNGTILPTADIEAEGWIAKRRRGSHGSNTSMNGARKATENVEGASIPGPRRSTESSRSVNRVKTPDSASPPPSRSSSTVDTHRHRSSTLLSLNPSPARPVTAKDHLTVSARGASSLQPSASADASSNSRLTVSSLLEQLTDIHDRQQQERQKEWDTFLKRRIRHMNDGQNSHKSNDLRWGSGLIGISQMGMSGKGGQEDWKSFTRLVRKGIPLKYRSDVWAECSGAKDLMVPGEYAEILAVHKNDLSPVHADIEKDVSRTFPGNVFFGGDGPGVAKLRRVLTAYSWHNPSVGYCQGMNMLAATLLLTHTDEEQAYWVLTSLIDRLLPTNFYSASLLASRADQVVLNDLVTQLVPKLHFHLEELGVDLASVTFGWWLSLFTDCLPVETLFRVWDVTFVEGHDTLFRVAIAILKLNEVEICATESVSDLFSFISNMTSRLWNADRLIALQHSYKPIIRHIDVVARCEKAVRALQQEMGDV
ncbi:uncharacterized protein I206_105736 [Kwoniella pini CBS 10737]|uniref:Rab-GAP TBC domain-containing protein n=1 Tax=Kwoniella pini CBS 10737 TaxID=1296096 RepID=A0AAJ8L9Z0_9TREE